MSSAHINIDMGEGFGLYRIGDDAALMPFIDAANVACGFHAADPLVMRNTVRLAKMHGVAVGAHPSLPDLQGFGRREMAMSADELTCAIVYQVSALKGFLDAEGLALNHIKPHGALYAMAAKDERVAEAVCDAAAVFGVPLYGLPGTCHEKVYTRRGLPFVAEFFVDLEYDTHGRVIITRAHPAWDPHIAAERAHRAVSESVVATVDGGDAAVPVETLCIHSDTPNALELAMAVRSRLSASTYSERPRSPEPLPPQPRIY